MQHDPLSSTTLEPYGYGYNNPVLFADPTGTCGHFVTFQILGETVKTWQEEPCTGGGGYFPGWGGSYYSGSGVDDPNYYCPGCSQSSYDNGFNAYAKEREENTLAWLGISNIDRFHASQSTLDNAIENTKVGQSVSAAENFLFIELPASFAGGELLAAGWKALGIGKVFSSVVVPRLAVRFGNTGSPLMRVGSGQMNFAAKGGLQYSDDLLKTAQQAYPKLAGKTQLHHITPKYLGGAADGPLIKLDAAYHQQITNEFRRLYGYGQGIIKDPAARQKIVDQVYNVFPLPK